MTDITTKKSNFIIKDYVFDIYNCDFSFYEDNAEYKKLTIINKFSGTETRYWYFYRNNFDDMKQYDIIKENIFRILKPIDLSVKLPESKKDTYNPGS